MTASFYPLGPTDIPKNLTKPSFSYKLRAGLALLAILIFFALYSALVFCLVLLLKYAIIYQMDTVNKWTIIMKLGAIAGAAMLLVFTLKFIFKLKNHKPENRIKLKKEDHPELWSFIYQVCKETGAPKPKHIYVDPDVNAYVSYTNTWLSLILPVRKELTIGLGIVSCLNLSEFKAVISHEFGHFAQRSMKIGSYIMSANTIIHDMIFSRDKWDRALDQWRASDIRLSAAAWVITPIIWLIRLVLNLFYQFLNIMYSSLSREMEFNADKVAASTAGSDSIISSLWKLDGGSEMWGKTLSYAYLAYQKKQRVKNLYTHYLLALERNLENQTLALNQLPEDSRGGKKFFTSSNTSKAGMYASHPPNDKREDSVKRPYIECQQDSRSPWILFSNDNSIQEQMTDVFYKLNADNKLDHFISVSDFEEFIKAESISENLFIEYSNTFENRFINIPDLNEIESVSEDIINAFNKIDNLKKEIKTLMEPVMSIELLMKKAEQISEGATTEKSFIHNNITYTKRNLQKGYDQLIKDRESLFESHFTDWDKQFCTIFLQVANNNSNKEELLKLYNQHKHISTFFKFLISVKGNILQQLNTIQSKENLSQQEINSFATRVNKYVNELNEKLKSINSIQFVPLPNIASNIELKEAIVFDGKFKNEAGLIFENGGFDRILNSIENSIINCQRIDQKSIGVILLKHKDIENHLSKN